MDIIIVGCGKVGFTLVEQLSNEDHNIIVIDEKPEKVQYITDRLDVMGIVGNGINHKTLLEAGIATADLLIAVTGDDEKNLLCCVIAKKTGHCQTIARVRNPIYNSEIAFLKKEFGLAMIINPELTAANEISRVFQFPSAIRVDSFAKGHVELLHFKVSENSPLIHLKLFNLHQTLHSNVLVCTVIRGSEVIIPNGDFEFRAGDTVAIASERRNAIDFFRKIGIVKNRVSNAILAGGGKVSFYLAKILIQSGIRVTIIEINPSRCDVLSELLPEATIICGDATDQDLLSEEGLEQAQGFAALTGLDEENILLSLYANDVSNAKTVTKINRSSFNSVINEMNLGSIIYPRVITADYILKYVRSTVNSINSNVETLYKLAGGKAEALEFIIKENSAVAGIPLQDLNFRKNTLICCIYRNGKVILPFQAAQRMIHSNSVTSLGVYIRDTDRTDETIDDMEGVLNAAFNYKDDAYRIINLESLLDTMDTMLGMMTTMLAGIASIALLVGGIGIMNMMLVSVSERTTEIGLRKALGARPKTIQMQFLLEAVMLSLLGGIIGILLGNLLSLLFAAWLQVDFELSTGAILLAFLFSATVGIIFGWAPARKASRLNPIDALRSM